jgi:hypothetical protein
MAASLALAFYLARILWEKYWLPADTTKYVKSLYLQKTHSYVCIELLPSGK